jgi:hypothetical protein
VVIHESGPAVAFVALVVVAAGFAGFRRFVEFIGVTPGRRLLVSSLPFVVAASGFNSLVSRSYSLSFFSAVVSVSVSMIGFYVCAYVGSRVRQVGAALLTGVFGVVFGLVVLFFSELPNPGMLLDFATVYFVSVVPLLVFSRLVDYRDSLWLCFPLVGHFADAASTFVVLRRGGAEVNLLIRYVNGYLGDWGVYASKIAVIPFVVFFVVREFDGFEKYYLLYLLGAWGLGVGVANLVSF